ncbi:MAG: hypothetical protein HY273_14130, partial [Gammaproteobacteria bacterium]|nr:hypothetical protein [Gammaproteobacteria bacterium]
TYDSATKTVNELHRHALVYAKKNGSFYKVSALTSNAIPTSTQLSSITSAEIICSTSVGAIDFADPDNSQIVYRTPGANALCNDSDDRYKMVRLNMGAADAPVSAKQPIGTAFHNWATTAVAGVDPGAISGWLVNDAGTLQRCDPNFANCGANLMTNIKSASLLIIAGSNRWLLEIDHAVYVYDDASSVAPKKIFTILDKKNLATGRVTGTVNDGSNFYFVTSEEPTVVHKAPVDGSLGATSFGVASSKPILGFTLSANTLLYWTENGITRVDKNSGGASTIVTGNFAAVAAVNSNHIYYSYNSNNAIPIAGMIDDDNVNNKTETIGANWLGIVYDTSWNLTDGFAGLPQTLIRAEGYSVGNGFAGATLHSITALNRTDAGILGTLPAGFSSIYCSSLGPDALCTGTSSTNQIDLFYLNATSPDSLLRITNTPAQSEAVVY